MTDNSSTSQTPGVAWKKAVSPQSAAEHYRSFAARLETLRQESLQIITDMHDLCTGNDMMNVMKTPAARNARKAQLDAKAEILAGNLATAGDMLREYPALLRQHQRELRQKKTPDSLILELDIKSVITGLIDLHHLLGMTQEKDFAKAGQMPEPLVTILMTRKQMAMAPAPRSRSSFEK